MNCPKCGGKGIKYGKVGDRQRYQCKFCNYQYTQQERKGKPLSIKFLALYLYLSGMSMRSIAKLINVSTTAVLKWMRNFSEKYPYETAKKAVKAVEIDEMWHFIQKKQKNTGRLRLLIEMTENYLLTNVAIEQSKQSADSMKN